MGRNAEGTASDNKVASVIVLVRTDCLSGACTLTCQHGYTRIPFFRRPGTGYLGLHNEAIPVLRQGLAHVSHLGLFARAF